MSDQNGTQEHWHRRLLEGNLPLFTVLATVSVLIGGMVEIIPMFSLAETTRAQQEVEPYSPLEVAGRDIYVSEGCYTCHSQWVRPFRSETLRYGQWSHSREYTWDRPFQLGSRRIGPDLHRVGGKYPDGWHYEHMRDPRSTSPGSVMPPYQWLLTSKIDAGDVQASIVALKTLGHPYSDEDVANVAQSLEEQGGEIVKRLAEAGIETTPDTQIVALIAYLQSLGRHKLGTDAVSDAAPLDDGGEG